VPARTVAGMWTPTSLRSPALPIGSASHFLSFEFLVPLACLLYAGLGCLLLTPGFAFDDDAVYLTLARALGAGEGYVDVYRANPIPHHHFPPGLPALLAVPSLLATDLASFVLLAKLLLLAFGVAGLYVVARYAREEGYSPAGAGVALLLAATSAPLSGVSLRVGSEFPYLFLSALALLLARRYEGVALTPRRALPLALTVALACVTRSIGVTLLAALVASRLFRRDFRGAATLLVVSCALLAPVWIAVGSTRAGGGDYVREFAGAYAGGASEAASAVARRVSYNAWRLADDEIPRAIFPPIASMFVRERATLDALALPIRFALTLFAVWAVALGGRERVALRLYVGFYAALVVCWPWDPARYLVPLVPFLLVAVAGAADTLARSAGRWIPEPRGLLAITAVVCLFGNAVNGVRRIAAVRSTGYSSPAEARLFTDLLEGYRWVGSETPPESLVACTAGAQAHLYLHTGRKTIPIPRHAARIERDRVAYVYVVKADSGGDALIPREDRFAALVRDAQVRLVPVFENATVAVYSVRGDER
jgi:hypothetical protein